MNLYSAPGKNLKQVVMEKESPVLLEFTKKTWWEHWLKQKKKYGMYCPYSKVLMTTITRTFIKRECGGGKESH